VLTPILKDLFVLVLKKTAQACTSIRFLYNPSPKEGEEDDVKEAD
jgi:hypothetical protein